MKHAFVLLLMLALLLPTAFAENATKTYEGDGFEHPEDAVEAYIEAFNRGDFSAMLSTFAIETAVDHMNQRSTAERLKAFLPNSPNARYFPVFDDYTRSVSIGLLVGEFSRGFSQQLLFYIWPPEYGDYDGSHVLFTSDDTVGKVNLFYDRLQESDFNQRYGRIEIRDFLSPEDLDLGDEYYSDENQKRLDKTCENYGCDELKDLAVSLSINSKHYIQYMQCARFGERWYNYNLIGNLALLAHIDDATYGLVRQIDM